MRSSSRLPTGDIDSGRQPARTILFDGSSAVPSRVRVPPRRRCMHGPAYVRLTPRSRRVGRTQRVMRIRPDPGKVSSRARRQSTDFSYRQSQAYSMYGSLGYGTLSPGRALYTRGPPNERSEFLVYAGESFWLGSTTSGGCRRTSLCRVGDSIYRVAVRVRDNPYR